ncbi:MAG: FAD-binding protein [Bacteroidia bacterium]|nr:FAD-binding protein [Bacteroidia bacterium]
MDKRTFLKTSTALATGTVLSRLVACAPNEASQPLKNWSGNLEYSTSNVHYPTTLEEVQMIVKSCTKLRGLGSRHSFNKIADSTENQVSLKEFNKVISLDKEANTVTVGAGMKYGELCQYLHENGYALHNLASLPHISIAGSITTATHGSGIKNGNLSTGVSAIEFVKANGEVIRLSKSDGEQFYGAVVSLGAVGIVTKVTLDLQPTFNMRQVVYLNLPMAELEKNFHAIMSGGYSVSLFTDWRNKNINEVWIKNRIEEGSDDVLFPTEYYGAKLATQNMHPVENLSAENCTEQMGVAGPWYERMPHFKMGFMPSAGEELQAEYFIPIEHGYAAMMAMETLHEKISPHLFISEIRTVEADNIWMSPCYNQTSAVIHTTWKQEEVVMDLLPLVEEKLAPFNPRPHWAKLFTIMPSILQSRIARLSEFKQLLNQYDPGGKFRNEFIETNLFGS